MNSPYSSQELGDKSLRHTIQKVSISQPKIIHCRCQTELVDVLYQCAWMSAITIECQKN